MMPEKKSAKQSSPIHSQTEENLQLNFSIKKRSNEKMRDNASEQAREISKTRAQFK